MEFTTYIRRPFTVEAVEITEENIEEVAEFIGTVKEDKGKKYIQLNRRLVPNVTRASVGWWLTILGDNYRCYAPKFFEAQFITKETDLVSFDFTEQVEEDETETVEPIGEMVAVLDIPAPGAFDVVQ